MGWIEKLPQPHKCEEPWGGVQQVGVGSTWQCDECDAKHVVVVASDGTNESVKM